MFLFDKGEAIGEEGLYWLKIHVANSGAFDKLDKKPFEERVKWVDENLPLITDYVKRPLYNTGWTKADSPFLFLAACKELVSSLTLGVATPGIALLEVDPAFLRICDRDFVELIPENVTLSAADDRRIARLDVPVVRLDLFGRSVVARRFLLNHSSSSSSAWNATSALISSNGDRRRAVEMLAAALKGLLRTPGVAVNKEWSRRVLRDVPAKPHDGAS
jgi:hypothetical protein